jgi:hypothetical protein
MTRRKEYLPIKEPKYRVYHQSYDRHRLDSPILNGGNSKPGLHTVFWDKKNLEGEAERIKEVTIPDIEKEIKYVIHQFKAHQQGRVNNGYEKPLEMPINMFEAKLRWEAALDVKIEELAEIEKKLANYTDQVVNESDELVLKFGLQGSGRFWGTRCEHIELMNVLKEIDGQECRLNKKGFLVIRDTRSPYNGMAVSDYRKLCAEWAQHAIEAENEKLQQLQKVAKDKGQPLPTQLPMNGVLKQVNRVNLPPVPKWAKIYTE